jgi:uncharacterized protein (AIM24 family)
MSVASSGPVCRYCRQPIGADAATCPSCGAPAEALEAARATGWVHQPAIPGMTRVTAGRSSLQVEGTMVPVADVGLAAGDSLYFGHQALLWMEPDITLDVRPTPTGWSRTMGDLPMVMLQATGPGHVALSYDSPGEIIAVPLAAGGELVVREYGFLAATGSVIYDWVRSDVRVALKVTYPPVRHDYPIGLYVDRFRADEAGLLLLHSPGNTYVRDLADGEEVLIQPNALLYAEPSLDMKVHVEYPAGSPRPHYWVRLTGPGRAAIRSRYAEPPDPDGVVDEESPGVTVKHW